MRRAHGRSAILASGVLVVLLGGMSAAGASGSLLKPVASPSLPFQADMEVSSLTGSPDPVQVGSDLTYTVTVSNNGPMTGGGMLQDQLDPTVTYSSSKVPPNSMPCVPTGSKVLCLISPLAPGGSTTLSIVVTPNQVGMVSNTATIEVTPESDPNPDNNSLTITTQVVPGPTPSPSGSPTSTPPPTEPPPGSPGSTPSGGIQTGFGGTAGPHGPSLLVLLAIVAVIGAALEGLRRLRRP